MERTQKARSRIQPSGYPFLPALTLAHRAFWAIEILLRAAADNVLCLGAPAVVERLVAERDP